MDINDLLDSTQFAIRLMADQHTGETNYVVEKLTERIEDRQFYWLLDVLQVCFTKSKVFTQSKRTREKQNMYFINRANKALTKSLLKDATNAEKLLDSILDEVAQKANQIQPLTQAEVAKLLIINC